MKTLTSQNTANGTTTRSMKLSQLIRGYPVLNVLGTLEKEIAAIAFDSRKVEAGTLFVAIHGLKQDGNRFIQDALQRGAKAFVTEVPIIQLNELGLVSNDVTAICVEDSRRALSWVSAEFYGRPSRNLNLMGITGTNGKTTLTYILEALFRTRGEATGVIGTINYRYGGIQAAAPVTTPESLDLNRMLHEMAREGVRACFLEVSSHSLALKRVRDMDFEIGIFTNLSRDHLDFHGTMENYKNAKKGLFRDNTVKKHIINTDDPAGREIAAEFQSSTLSVGIDHPAELMAEDCALSQEGSRFTLKTPSGSRVIQSELLGRHNIYNLLLGAAAAFLQGFSLEAIERGIQTIKRIPGRFERLDCGQNFSVVVDYAHTGDALENVLSAARAFTRKNVIAVFGCGGDRDRGKRAEMGRIALEQSDFAIITSDNPRTENPQRILDDIIQGVPSSAKIGRDYRVIASRGEAIECAVNHARKGDLVMIAGKGHEDYQILNTGTIHFDDREIAGNAIRKRLNID